jgi:iron complex outermembrane receptor protein
MKTKVFAAIGVFSLTLAAGARSEVPNLAGPVFQWDRPILGAQRLPDVKIDETRVPSQVRVFTREEIEASGARTIQELLAEEAGVNVYDQVGNGFQQTVSLRGFNAQPFPSDTQVVVDGVRTNENDVGTQNLHLIPLEDIERLEIHYGPNTKFGRSALGGVIHVTTRRGGSEAVSAEAGVAYGSYNRKKGNLAVRGTISDFDYSISGVKEIDDGYRQNARVQVSNLKAKLGWRASESQDVWVSYQRSDDRIQQPGSLTLSEFGSDPRQHATQLDFVGHMDFVNIAHRVSLPWGLTGSWNGYLRERRASTPLFIGRTSAFAPSLMEYKSRGLAGQLGHDGEVFGRRIVTTLGAEGRRDTTDRNNQWGTFLLKENSQGFFAESVADVLEAVSLTAGLRYDRIAYDHEDHTTASKTGKTAFHRTSPRFGVNVNPSDRVRFWASYAEAFRAPNVWEMDRNPAQNLLKPVRSESYELGGKALLARGLEFSAAVFRTEARNDIYYDGVAFKNINVDKTRRVGVDWTLAAKARRWEAKLNHAWTQATFQSAFALGSAAKDTVQKNDRMPLVPEHKATVGLAFKPVNGLRLSADEVCVGRQRVLGDAGNRNNLQPGYCETNLGARYTRGDWSLFANGYNVLDSRHAVWSNDPSFGTTGRVVVPASGATVRAGVTYRFSSGPSDVAKKLGSIAEIARNALRD